MARDAASALVGDVVVVVDLGGCLAGKGPKNSPGVLDEVPSKGDRGGEEQGVPGS